MSVVTETQPAEVGGNPPGRTYEPGVGQLAAALAAVQQELPPIRKAETGKVSGTTKDGKQYSYEYSYADLAAVSAAVMPLLGKNGLAFTTWPTTVDGRLVLRYHLVHESGERMDGEYPLPPADKATAQQLGSAITYARRYCLCAVTGVAPDDDDDAAAADGAKAQRRAEQQAEVDQELQHAVDAVRGAWALQFGGFDQPAALEMYRTWSQGQKGTLTTATAGQLRSFAAYLTNLPKADAGSEPPTQQGDGRYRDPDAPLSPDQRTRIIASLSELGIKDRQDRLQWMSSTLGRPVASTNDLTMAEAGQLIDTLNGGVDVTDADI